MSDAMNDAVDYSSTPAPRTQAELNKLHAEYYRSETHRCPLCNCPLMPETGICSGTNCGYGLKRPESGTITVNPAPVTGDSPQANVDASGSPVIAGKQGANAVQVGGLHYKKQRIEHWDWVAANGLDYFQGCITKYVSRWRDKDKLQDLKKAAHYLQKYIEEVESGRIV